MKLTKILIHAFRSVVNQEIEMNENCIGFIGLNESGKTNVLQAIRTLDNNFPLSIKDKSKINDELPKIDFLFDLDVDEKLILLDKCNEELLKHSITEAKVLSSLEIFEVKVTRKLSFTNGNYEPKRFIKFQIKTKSSKKYLILNKDASILPETLINIEGKELPLNSIKVIEKDLIVGASKELYSDLGDDAIISLIENVIRGFIRTNIPEVRYWEYDSQYLLPAEMTYDQFVDNDEPYNNSAPLYNIFLISNDLNVCDTDDLKEKITEWKADSSMRRKDSGIITRDINAHIKKIWQDYDQELKIELEETKITIHVNDPKSSKMNFYDMGLRSQGFKTFISFILTISAEVETGILENYILILDEPETHLHPSGVRYMRKELMELSDDVNYVFYATHSIFMIDRENLRRHVIIKKDDEQTKLLQVDRNNILQEEVIYEALGTSLDEFSISNENIVFEGELDLKLFSVFMEHCVEKKENKLAEYDFLDGGGTNRILKFFTDKVLPQESKWTFILDRDAAGRKLETGIKKLVSETFQNNLNFTFYSEEDDFELEDLLPKDIIVKAFDLAKTEVDFDEIFSLNLNQSKPVGSIIDEYYGKNKIRDENKKKIEEKFKLHLDDVVNSVLDNIKKEKTIEKKLKKIKEDIPGYFQFISSFVTSFGVKLKDHSLTEISDAI